jgi:NitT/TauT family transport system ATP-binding protein
MIRFLNVTKSFNSLKVLDRLSFDVEENEIVGILGPSGIGKTTILRLVTGALRPDSGEVKVASSRIGYVFQEPRLLPWRTAIENISLSLRAEGMGGKEAGYTAQKWMEKLGLMGFEDYYPAQLSGGMMQRVSIARAFAIEPKILLMDEPFSNLDVKLKDSLLTMVENMIRESRTTVIYVTHYLPEILRLSDRILELDPEHGLKELELNDRESIIMEFISSVLTGSAG